MLRVTLTYELPTDDEHAAAAHAWLAREAMEYSVDRDAVTGHDLPILNATVVRVD